MKKLSTYLFLILFSFQTPSWADDISDFQIEGMSIGDSALAFFNENEIKKNSKNFFKKKDYTLVQNDKYSFFETYDAIDFMYKTNDNGYKIKWLTGVLYYTNNIKDCYPKLKSIEEDINSKVGDKTKKRSKNQAIHRADPTGKSNFSYVYFDFKSGDSILITCYDYSKEDGGQDHLAVTFVTKEVQDFFAKNPYEPY